MFCAIPEATISPTKTTTTPIPIDPHVTNYYIPPLSIWEIVGIGVGALIGCVITGIGCALLVKTFIFEHSQTSDSPAFDIHIEMIEKRRLEGIELSNNHRNTLDQNTLFRPNHRLALTNL